MTNFHQACRIDTKFNPPLIRQNDKGKLLVGKIYWLDGKDKLGKNIFTNFDFVAANPEIIALIEDNIEKTFIVDGFLKTKSWEKDGKKFYGSEIRIVRAELYNGNKIAVSSYHETDSEIPF